MSDDHSTPQAPIQLSDIAPQPVPVHHSLFARLRNYFLTGLILVGPLYITINLTWWFINWVDDLMRPFIPIGLRAETYLPFQIPGYGVITALLALTLLGFLTANLVGRTLVEFSENLLNRMVFDDWVARHQPQSAVLVVRRSGRTVYTRGHNADPLKPTMIASLSKPITGACVATLVRDNKISFTTRMREALPRFFRRYGTPADPRLEHVTVEQLLVHRSGLVGNEDNDPIYGAVSKRTNSGKGYLAAVSSMLGEYLIKLKLMRDPGKQYSYSNTGYEVLSALIEERTQRPYEDYCREAVFGKLGIAEPKLHPDWRLLSGAGGWFIPGPDYLAFFDIFSPSHPFLNDTVKGWIDRAQIKWTPSNRDRWYGLGVNMARTGCSASAGVQPQLVSTLIGMAGPATASAVRSCSLMWR